ncbi:unnamed protein product, partial [Amoebophrya sp. A120]
DPEEGAGGPGLFGVPGNSGGVLLVPAGAPGGGPPDQDISGNTTSTDSWLASNWYIFLLWPSYILITILSLP